jgi:dienelactone hydrolase
LLIVEAVDGSGRAQVIYGVGDTPDGSVRRAFRRVAGHIVADLLTVELGEGATATYHIDGRVLRGTYTTARRRYTVTLTRATLAEAAAVPARVTGIHTGTTIRIPTLERGSDGQPVTLEATLYRPPGDGPAPVLLFNHGSTGGGRVAPTVTLRPDRIASVFVDRGLAVLAPMRRGRGASGGLHGEFEGSCDARILGEGLARAIDDVDAAMAYLRAQAWADPRRVLVGGQSRGGILSVAYAAERPDAARAVINFAGGWTTQRCDEAGEGFNQATFAAAGAKSRITMLWLYGEEDSFYAATWTRRYHETFVRAGGVATFHLFPPFGADGHRLVDRPELWKGVVDDFLRSLGLTP